MNNEVRQLRLMIAVMVERILGLVSQLLVISMPIGLALGYDMRESRRRAVVRKRCYQKRPRTMSIEVTTGESRPAIRVFDHFCWHF